MPGRLSIASLRVPGAWFIAFASLIAGTASAAELPERHALFSKGWSVDVGVFNPDREFNLRVNGSLNLENLPIDFDERFNIGTTGDLFAAELSWRFNNRWTLLAQYFEATDKASATLDRDVEWADLVFGANTGVSAGTNFALYRTFIGRKLDTPERHDVGFGGGLHQLDVGAFIQGTVVVNGIPASRRESVGTSAILPNVGAWYWYSISPRWIFKSRLDVLSARVGKYNGLLLNASLGVNFQAFEHAGIGIAYNYFELDVAIDESNWHGDIETRYNGIFLYLSAYF